jgi:hypothetical protein
MHAGAARAPLRRADRGLGAGHPGRGLAVVLTGTDLYQDIAAMRPPQRSLALAQRLVVLQECGPQACRRRSAARRA